MPSARARGRTACAVPFELPPGARCFRCSPGARPRPRCLLCPRCILSCFPRRLRLGRGAGVAALGPEPWPSGRQCRVDLTDSRWAARIESGPQRERKLCCPDANFAATVPKRGPDASVGGNAQSAGLRYKGPGKLAGNASVVRAVGTTVVCWLRCFAPAQPSIRDCPGESAGGTAPALGEQRRKRRTRTIVRRGQVELNQRSMFTRALSLASTLPSAGNELAGACLQPSTQPFTSSREGSPGAASFRRDSA
jgi:hypothetical protein